MEAAPGRPAPEFQVKIGCLLSNYIFCLAKSININNSPYLGNLEAHLIYLEAHAGLQQLRPAGNPGIDLEVTQNMLSCMSKYSFVRIRISILVSKIIYCTWRPLEANQVQIWRSYPNKPIFRHT